MNKFKLFIAPVVAVLLIAATLFTYLNKGQYVAAEEEGQSGLIYADFFTENTARYEWMLGLNKSTIIPQVDQSRLRFSGWAGAPGFAMLKYELPEKFDITLSADIERRGGNDRSPAFYFNVGETIGDRYMLWLDYGSIKLTQGAETVVLSKKVEALTNGKAYSLRLSVSGSNLKIYFDGNAEPLVNFTATGDFESFANARYFGVYCYAYEFYLDNLLITDGKNQIKAKELKITGKDNKSTVKAGEQLQMMAFVNPSNATDTAFIWSTDNKEIAEITTDGVLTAKKEGIVTVTAKSRDGSMLSATRKITVKASDEKNSGSAPVASEGKLLADDYSKVFESDSPDDVYCYSPAVTILPSGRIIATCDLGGDGITKYTPVGYDKPQLWTAVGRVAYSDDNGKTWKYPFDGSFMFAQPFYSGKDVYIVARNGENNSNLVIYKSEDEGETWSDKVVLDKRSWHSAPTEAIYVGDYIYMTMEVSSKAAVEKGESGVACLAPLLMRAKIGTDLTDIKNWTFSEELAFSDIIPDVFAAGELDYFGVPYVTHAKDGSYGWLEGNVLQIYDKTHEWYDPTMKTFYILLRAQTMRGNYGAVMKVVEQEDGSMKPSVVLAPSGRTFLFLQIPGGHSKFGTTYDPKSKTYWMITNYAMDSMTSSQFLSGDQSGQAFSDRSRLALYFSKNLVDWQYGGMVTEGKDISESRSYATLTIQGDDILVFSRTGDEKAASLHDTNIISMHRVKKFRDLLY